MLDSHEIGERLSDFLTYSLNHETKKPAGNTPDGAMVNSALYGLVCHYRQTPSFQMLIS